MQLCMATNCLVLPSFILLAGREDSLGEKMEQVPQKSLPTDTMILSIIKQNVNLKE